MSLHRPPRDAGHPPAPGPEEARLGPVYLWVLFLAGPLIWAIHFVVVYLVTEAVCGIDPLRLDSELFGLPAASVFVLGATVAALVALAFFANRSLSEWREEGAGRDAISRLVGAGGFFLVVVFALAVASVGVPAVALSPC